MSATLAPIASGAAIVETDPKGRAAGTITVFFRQWLLALLTRIQQAVFVPKVPLRYVGATILSGTLAPVAAYTMPAAGIFRVSYYLRVTSPDGVSSSVAMTLAWVESGQGLLQTFPAVTGDVSTAEQNGSIVVEADGLTDLTVGTTYASNTPNKMQYRLSVIVEQVQ